MSSLADAMNEITHLRHTYEDYDEWEGEDEEFECDDLDKWYKDDAGCCEAAGVGDLDYGERARRATTPLFGPLTRPNLPGSNTEVQEPPDLIPATNKAAHAATIAASYMTHNTKACEKLSVPAFPKSGDMSNWMYALGTTTFVAGCLGDELEVTWLRNCWRKSFEELECSDMYGAKRPTQMEKRLDSH